MLRASVKVNGRNAAWNGDLRACIRIDRHAVRPAGLCIGSAGRAVVISAEVYDAVPGTTEAAEIRVAPAADLA